MNTNFSNCSLDNKINVNVNDKIDEYYNHGCEVNSQSNFNDRNESNNNNNNNN